MKAGLGVSRIGGRGAHQLGAVPREPGPAGAEGGVAGLGELGLERVEAAEVLVDLRAGRGVTALLSSERRRGLAGARPPFCILAQSAMPGRNGALESRSESQ